MKIQITYHDDKAFTAEEVVSLAHTNYGKSAKVEIHADSLAPHDQIYFALQQIVTHKQLAMLFDDKFTYQKDIKGLRAETLLKLEEILDSVIIDNESKVA